AHFAIDIRQGSEIGNGPFDIPHGALIRHAAGSTNAGAIFLGATFAFSGMQVLRDGDIAMVCKLVSNILRRLDPARHMMDQHVAWMVARSGGTGQVRIDQIALMAMHVDGLSRHCFVWHSVSLLCSAECV